MRAVAGRLEVKQLPGGARLVDDSYNANPASVRAGLCALAAIGGQRWLVLGEMRELGPESALLHAEIGEFARQSGVARLLAVGDEARWVEAHVGESTKSLEVSWPGGPKAQGP